MFENFLSPWAILKIIFIDRSCWFSDFQIICSTFTVFRNSSKQKSLNSTFDVFHYWNVFTHNFLFSALGLKIVFIFLNLFVEIFTLISGSFIGAISTFGIACLAFFVLAWKTSVWRFNKFSKLWPSFCLAMSAAILKNFWLLIAKSTFSSFKIIEILNYFRNRPFQHYKVSSVFFLCKNKVKSVDQGRAPGRVYWPGKSQSVFLPGPFQLRINPEIPKFRNPAKS